ncbi:MAG: hypothetical protein R2751_19015 [Bacteroidales bacterium]
MFLDESGDPGIRYFSGTARYTRRIDAPESWFPGEARFWLDLGEVENLAEVFLNGTSLGIVWKKPFKVDVSDALKPGSNELEIRVTNLWVNRLIGDQQLEEANPMTYTTMPFYRADSPCCLPACSGRCAW